ncbi:MAG: fimbrial biogenesis chaperone [Endozoicomonas sp.]|uniref:fimbrial biogenesis chaperone n=1 Tax=Endozoicomonas sp. TaxID=1892382 RepID=UPI003D9AD10A
MSSTYLRHLPAVLVILLGLFSQSTLANMSLDRMIVYFNPGKTPRQDIVVTNPDRENLYLQTEVYKVVNPGTEKEERIRITDPALLKLLATPQRAILPPNSRKTIRLVSLETPKDKESVYRVTFKPVTGDLQAKQNAIKILVAYQALVFIRPNKPEYNVAAQAAKETITFTNSGNINVVLRNGQYCTSGQSESCTSLATGSRIYAGESWSMKLPKGALKGKGFIQFGLFDGLNEETRKFPL